MNDYSILSHLSSGNGSSTYHPLITCLDAPATTELQESGGNMWLNLTQAKLLKLKAMLGSSFPHELV